MRRLPGIALLVALVAVAPVLAGCDSFDPDSLDPFGLNKKKVLPGKRELLFPGGVPGVSNGIPPEYKEGYKTPGLDDLPPGDGGRTPAAQTAKNAPVEPVRQSNLGKPVPVHQSRVKPKPKAKPPHRMVKRKPTPKPKPVETAVEPKGTQAPWPSTPPQETSAQPKGTSAPWPSTSSQQTQAGWPGGQRQEQKLAPWPSAPPSGTFSK